MIQKIIPYILLGILVLAGMNFYKSCNQKQGISPEVQKILDSVKTANNNLAIENATDKQLIKDVQQQNIDLQLQLSQIPQQTTQRIIEYKNSTPEQKQIIISSQVKQMQEEMKK